MLLSPDAKNPKTDKDLTNNKTNSVSLNDKKKIAAALKRISQLEGMQSEIENLMSDTNFYNQESEVVERTLKESASISKDLEKAFMEWENLEQ